MTRGNGSRYERRKVGVLVTLRVGAALTGNSCRKWNCSVPRSPSDPPDRLGVRSSSDCPVAIGERHAVAATASPRLRKGVDMVCYCVTSLDTILDRWEGQPVDLTADSNRLSAASFPTT